MSVFWMPKTDAFQIGITLVISICNYLFLHSSMIPYIMKFLNTNSCFFDKLNFKKDKVMPGCRSKPGLF